SQTEIEAFSQGADDTRAQWRAELGDDASDPGLIGNALIAIEHLQALTQAWRPRKIRAPLTVWWSTRDVDASALKDKTPLWRACSEGATQLAGMIDTDHVGIVRDASMLSDLARRLKELSSNQAEQDGSKHG
ncbi:hypothetical protein BHUM_05893c, partial [Candidatus Burkholderia humilis]